MKRALALAVLLLASPAVAAEDPRKAEILALFDQAIEEQRFWQVCFNGLDSDRDIVGGVWTHQSKKAIEALGDEGSLFTEDELDDLTDKAATVFDIDLDMTLREQREHCKNSKEWITKYKFSQTVNILFDVPKALKGED